MSAWRESFKPDLTDRDLARGARRGQCDQCSLRPLPSNPSFAGAVTRRLLIEDAYSTGKSHLGYEFAKVARKQRLCTAMARSR